MAVAALAAAAPAGAAPGDVTERKIRSLAPDSRIVKTSVVRIEKPLADQLGAPRACDFIEYLRFRHRNGPRRSVRADFVFVAIPGFLGGAGSFDQLARNTVREVGRDGKRAEFWALDRRSNCLEDDRGIRAARRAGDPQIAYDYYWGGEPVNGKTFGGWYTGASAPFVESFDLEHTLNDWKTVVKRSMPGRKRRARKLLCGGHSLGGSLTAAFASWDFDGDPQTKRDAGYKQCAGLFGLDTTLDLAGGGDGGAGIAGEIASLIALNPASPFLDVPPLSPETIQVPAVFGVGAFFAPDDTDLLANLPHTPKIDLSQRILFSKDAVNFATGMPSIRDFTITNELALAGIFDDNSAGLSFIRASLGFLSRGAVGDKNFPAPGDGTFAIPTAPDSGTYAWKDHREVRPPYLLNESGEPYTSRESEVSSVKQFGRTMFEGPANFIEQYFPLRLIEDVSLAEGGAFEDLVHDGPGRRAILLIQAGDSDDNSAEDSGRPFVGEPPNEKPLSVEVIIPGYNHLDVLTAARRQNDGRVEPSSANLADWGRKLVRMRRPKPGGPGAR